MKIIKLMTVEEPTVTIKKPKDILNLSIKDYLSEQDQENFVAIGMNGQYEVSYVRVIHVGTLNLSIVHPRDVFRDAIKENCCALIVVHNHPSGSISPSQQDINTTDRLVECGKMLGIEVLDSIILTKNEYFSFLEHDMIGGDDE